MSKHTLRLIVPWLVVGSLIGFTVTWSLLAVQPISAQLETGTRNFDPDVHPPIDIIHLPPTIVGSEESVTLEFSFACGLSEYAIQGCQLERTLYVAWGNEPFRSIRWTSVSNNRAVASNLPISSYRGEGLHYYIEVQETQTGISVRYPVYGTIRPTIAPSLIPVNLAPPEQVNARTILFLPWGEGEKEVGLDARPEHPIIGPDAVDVALDGTIALLDEGNHRVVLVNSVTGMLSSFPVPLNGVGDIEFDDQGRITVLDRIGEPTPNIKVPIPQLYRFERDGTLISQAAVFAELPSELIDAHTVLDMNDVRTVTPLDEWEREQTRDAQRASRRTPILQEQFLAPTRVRLADSERGLAFELSSDSELGAIAFFERTESGYVVVFERSETFRVTWLSGDGDVQRDISVQRRQYANVNPRGRVAASQDGSIFILTSTEEGIEILYVQRSLGEDAS